MSRGDQILFNPNLLNLSLQNNLNYNYFQGKVIQNPNNIQIPQLSQLNAFQINQMQQIQPIPQIQQINNMQISQIPLAQKIPQINQVLIPNLPPQIPQSIENLPQIDDEDDYSGLSYKNSSKCTKEPANQQNKKNRCSTMDFRTKWKTEICHFWELNGYCQFGENVNI